MDPLVAAYLETVAILSMSFIGFSAIVILLRQSDGRKLLIAIVGALLPPLFEFWQLPPTAAFRLASGFMALVLFLCGATVSARRHAAPRQPTPLYFRLTIVTPVALLVVAFALVAFGFFDAHAEEAYLSVLSAVLVFFVITWLRVLNLIQPARSHTDTESPAFAPMMRQEPEHSAAAET